MCDILAYVGHKRVVPNHCIVTLSEDMLQRSPLLPHPPVPKSGRLLYREQGVGYPSPGSFAIRCFGTLSLPPTLL